MCTRLCTSQLRIKGILDWPEEPIPGYRGSIVAHSFSQGSLAQLVVPLSLRNTVFNDSHHTTYGGHFGMTHTHTQQDTVTLLLAWNVRFNHGQNHCMPQMYCTKITSESPPTNGTCTSVRKIRTCGYGSAGRICHLRQRT